MRPLCHFVWSIANVCAWIKCPVVTALYHILTNREGCRECHDFFEIRAVIGKIDLKSLIINCCNSKSAWISTSISNCVISFYHVDHVAVICCCLRICKTLPCINEVTSCYSLSIRPFDSVTKFNSVSNCTIFVLGLFPGLSLSRSCDSISFTIIYPFSQTFEHMVAHDSSINCRVQCRVNCLWFRCDTKVQIESFVRCCILGEYRSCCHA